MRYASSGSHTMSLLEAIRPPSGGALIISCGR
jgi:hypothetical protein